MDYVVNNLPSILHSVLAKALRSAGDGELNHDAVSKVLVDSISELDNNITRDILELFPGGPEALEKLSDEQIDTIVNDFDSGGVNNAKLLRGMRGSTVLIALIDPSGRNLYVASLGDCQAGMFIVRLLHQWSHLHDQSLGRRLRLAHGKPSY